MSGRRLAVVATFAAATKSVTSLPVVASSLKTLRTAYAGAGNHWDRGRPARNERAARTIRSLVVTRQCGRDARGPIVIAANMHNRSCETASSKFLTGTLVLALLLCSAPPTFSQAKPPREKLDV